MSALAFAALGFTVTFVVGHMFYLAGARRARTDTEVERRLGLAVINRMHRLDVGDTAELRLRHVEPGKYLFEEAAQ